LGLRVCKELLCLYFTIVHSLLIFLLAALRIGISGTAERRYGARNAARFGGAVCAAALLIADVITVTASARLRVSAICAEKV